ncbi:MAG: hypothetical protein ACRDIE_26720, partial [Chloroflexota bacterium]
KKCDPPRDSPAAMTQAAAQGRIVLIRDPVYARMHAGILMPGIIKQVAVSLALAHAGVPAKRTDRAITPERIVFGRGAPTQHLASGAKCG